MSHFPHHLHCFYFSFTVHNYYFSMCQEAQEICIINHRLLNANHSVSQVSSGLSQCGLWTGPHTSKDTSHLSLQLSRLCLFSAHRSGNSRVLKDKPPFPPTYSQLYFSLILQKYMINTLIRPLDYNS